MKLIHYTLRNLFVPILVIFAAWGCVFCLMILHEVEDETNDSLENYKEIIIRSALADSTLLKDHVDIMTRYYIREVPESEAKLDKDEFYDTTVYIEIEQEYEPVRALRTYFMTKDRKFYELTLELSTLEQEDMIETIIWSMAVLYIALISCILFMIHRGFKRGFKPLYKLLSWLKSFQVGKYNPPLNNPTPIEEFKILNETVQESVNQSDKLYNKQRHFVENAAHELQTPLAVCMNKLELLSEHPDCTEDQLKEIAGLHQALNGIIRLNKSLLLLSRIDNKQFPETRDICLNHLIHKILEGINDIYERKALHLRVSEKESLVCTMNESLATTLITNLIKNAYVHNYEKGDIGITISRRMLTIANTGIDKTLDKELLFARFASQSKQQESTGLGLAIVKSIVDLYSIRIDYQYANGMHTFTLLFY